MATDRLPSKLALARDGSESVRAEVRGDGSLNASFRYRAYGDLAQTTGPLPGLLGYAGQVLDNSGLYYLRARWYDPATGRFITRDPVTGEWTHPARLNAFGYAHANPVVKRDETGLAVPEELQDDLHLTPRGLWAKGPSEQEDYRVLSAPMPPAPAADPSSPSPADVLKCGHVLFHAPWVGLMVASQYAATGILLTTAVAETGTGIGIVVAGVQVALAGVTFATGTALLVTYAAVVVHECGPVFAR